MNCIVQIISRQEQRELGPENPKPLLTSFIGSTVPNTALALKSRGASKRSEIESAERGGGRSFFALLPAAPSDRDLRVERGVRHGYEQSEFCVGSKLLGRRKMVATFYCHCLKQAQTRMATRRVQ